MKYAFLAFAILINIASSMAGDFHEFESRTQCILTQLAPQKKNKNNYTKTPTYGFLRKFNCYNDKSCKTKLIRLSEGFKILQAKNPKYLDSIIKHFNTNKVSPHIMNFLSDCLKVKKKSIKCSTKQFNSLSQILDYPWKHSLHPNYVKKLLALVSSEKTSGKLSKALNFMADNRPVNTVPVKGEFNKLIRQGNRYFEPNKGHNSSPGNTDRMVEVFDRQMDNSKFTSLQREDEAFKLLNLLGYDVHIASTKPSVRNSQGIGQKYNKLRAEDGIKDRDPDVILNGNYIADIYSPIKPVSDETISTIVDRVLVKSEGDNFETVVLRNRSKGKRQTNRVVIYIDSYLGPIETLAKQIHMSIGEQNPKYLQEAIIIFRRNGKPEQMDVWP